MNEIKHHILLIEKMIKKFLNEGVIHGMLINEVNILKRLIELENK